MLGNDLKKLIKFEYNINIKILNKFSPNITDNTFGTNVIP
jgi:hypothetical protein